MKCWATDPDFEVIANALRQEMKQQATELEALAALQSPMDYMDCLMEVAYENDVALRAMHDCWRYMEGLGATNVQLGIPDNDYESFIFQLPLAFGRARTWLSTHFPQATNRQRMVPPPLVLTPIPRHSSAYAYPLPKKELREDRYRNHGFSCCCIRPRHAIRLTHKPTGAEVVASHPRSIEGAYALAMRTLTAKVLFLTGQLPQGSQGIIS